MSFIKKLFSKFKKKPDTVEELTKKNQENSLFESNQEKFDDGLKKSSSSFSEIINQLSTKYVTLNEEFYEDLFDSFVQLDIGYNATKKIVDAITEEIKYQKVIDPTLIKQIIVDKLFVYYIQDSEVNIDLNYQNNRQNVFLVVGVNGVGKTTSIAKLANYYKKLNKNVLLIAADTFRAGAVEQLNIWANRLGVDIYKDETKKDPAAVIYEGLSYAKDKNYDLVICDTSGRLQNKVNLMNELKKINGVIEKFIQRKVDESLLVLDATTGQSGLMQAKVFHEVSNITGIILTKMDSSSKGGIILGIKDLFNIPVKLIGLGEKLDDLVSFDLQKYLISLTANLKLDYEKTAN
ncbi:signal recognition particle-docking protein FtsY [Mycoplasma bradburyae]|uniref:Signal recognition particle receptor FtsY n=1 Tax=Mycoplasma bradburyae TaxID=2963128 RepID=A0AAW6HP97_9MOLU|nr:signal recognition particle-docking protein FtsY [Mycoplasma bradburyae]MDC4183600.1 signal recognition particle-docking protein FtsY [Mycoplasma bradburyae]UTS71003.1 signal recognition particle-docking protein FtsY [Mycoplasma bradburyae]